MPIGFDVQARADEKSLDRIASQAERRFGEAGKKAGQAFSKGIDEAASKADPKAADRWTKAYDKVADAAGKVRAEEAKLADLRSRGASDSRLITQAESLERARRAEARATNDAATAYMNLGAKTSGLMSSLTSLTAGTRFGGMISDAEMLTSKFGGMGLAVGGTITAVAGLAIGVAEVTRKFYDMGAQWDAVSDSITSRTGMVGDKLAGVMDQVTRIGPQTAASMGDLGDIMGRVVQSMGLSGDAAGNMTQRIAELNAQTGESANIRGLAEVFRVFNITDAQAQLDVLDSLYSTYQATGIPVSELTDDLQKNGAALSTMHMDVGKAVGILATFEQAGVKSDVALKGMTAAIGKLGAAGLDPATGMPQLIARIKELHDAGKEAEAIDLAKGSFGKSFAPLLVAIESGKVNISALTSNTESSRGAIQNATRATEDFSQEWTKFKNFLDVELKPASDWVFSQMSEGLKWITEDLKMNIGLLKDLLDPIQGGNVATGSALGPAGNPLGLIAPGGPPGSATLGPRSPLDILAPGLAPAGTAVRGAPGRGFPLPWTLPALDSGAAAAASGMSARDFAHQSMMPYWQSMGFTVGDHGADKYVEHQNGALDIMVPSIEAGSRVLQQVLSDPNVYGAIFNNQSFGYGNGPGARDYSAGHTGNPRQDHQDHVHVWYKPGGSNNIAAAGGQPQLASSTFPLSPGGGFGPGYQPGPATGTPGYNDMGQPGYYVTDPRQIRGANERIGDITKAIGDANQAILDAQQDQIRAIQHQAEVEQKLAEVKADILATDEDRKSAADQAAMAARQTDQANRNLNRATEQRDRLVNRDLRDANESLADANRGSFHGAQKAPGMGRGGMGGLGQVGASLANDFGISGGLPGIAQNLTTFLANLAFAPAIGALSAVQAVSPIQGGFGLAGVMGAQNMAQGLSPIGMPMSSPGMGGGMGGGLFGGGFGAAPGPMASTVSGVSPAAGPGGGGFQGLGGLPMAGLKAATAGLDMLAPGAGQAASTGIQLVNRTAAFAGQVGGILAGGVLETLNPTDSAAADPANSWFGRIASGVAGGAPALPNTAGQSALAPQGQQQGAGQPQGAQGPNINVTYNNNQATEDRAGKDLTNHLTAMYQGPGQP